MVARVTVGEALEETETEGDGATGEPLPAATIGGSLGVADGGDRVSTLVFPCCWTRPDIFCKKKEVINKKEIIRLNFIKIKILFFNLNLFKKYS
jgi:hypothetical protein